MKPLKTDKIESSLVKKGFSAENGDHKYYILYCNGKKTQIFTKVSHGKPEIGEPLLGKMAKQVRLSKKDFADLIECPLSKERYMQMMKNQGNGRDRFEVGRETRRYHGRFLDPLKQVV